MWCCAFSITDTTVLAAAEKNLKFTFDQLFRSYSRYLLDCSTSEWLFCMDWFGPNDMFGKIFATPLQLCLSSLTTYLKTCYDVVGLLIMLRVNAMCKQGGARFFFSSPILFFSPPLQPW